MVRCLIFLVMVLFSSTAFAGTAYYIDCSVSNSAIQNGTYAQPYNHPNDISSQWEAFSNGDDFYFKVGTTCNVTQNFRPEISGTADDPVVIGAYYGDGQFGLNGGARPIFDARNTAGVRSTGIIRVYPTSGLGYYTIKDIEVRNTIGYGIEVNGRDGTGGYLREVLVENCKTSYTDSVGIGLWRTWNGSVKDCYVEYANQLTTYPYNGGNSIDVGALELEGTSNYNTVEGCTVFGGNEGIGFYKGTRYFTCRDNLIINNRVPIYVANSRDGVVEQNVIIGSTAGGPNQGYHNSGIAVDAEDNRIEIPKLTGNIIIRNNYIAGTKSGIKILNNSGDSKFGSAYDWTLDNIQIYGNRIFDCGTTTGTQGNILFRHSEYYGSNVHIWDNFSFIIDEGSLGLDHVETASPANVKWYSPTDSEDGNFFNSTVSGNAGATADPTDTYTSVKQSGWRSLSVTPGAVTASTFALTDEPSTDTCQSLGYECCVTGTGTHYSAYDGDCDGAEECWSACSSGSGSDPTLDTTNTFGGVVYTPILLLPFHEGVGEVANDISGENNDAVLVNADWDDDGLTVSSAGQTVAAPIADLNGEAIYTIAIEFTSVEQSAANDYGKFWYYYNSSVRDFQLERNTADTIYLSDIGGVGNSATFSGVQDQFTITRRTLVLTVNDTENRRVLYQDGAYLYQDTTAFSNPTYTGNLYIGGKNDGTRAIGVTYHLFGIWTGEWTLSDVQSFHADSYQMINNLDRGSSIPIGGAGNTRVTTMSTDRTRITRMGN